MFGVFLKKYQRRKQPLLLAQTFPEENTDYLGKQQGKRTTILEIVWTVTPKKGNFFIYLFVLSMSMPFLNG